MENISFQYPAWYLLFCGLLGIIYAVVLYYRDQRFKTQHKSLIWALGFIRFLTVSFLSILLLAPLLKSFVTEVKKPVVVLAQDQSESIASEMGEADLTQYKNNFQQLQQSLAEDYELKLYAFGNEVREGVDFEFTDKVSNISKLLTNVYDLYSNQNLGAIIVATDGIYNEGSNPIYAGAKLAAPIYTIALGDTTPQVDLLIKRVYYNKIAYLGDKFSIQVDIAAQNCTGNTSMLKVSKVNGSQSQSLQQMPIKIDKNNFFTTKEIVLEANQSGVQRYKINLSKVGNEVTTLNNSKEIFIDVLDARQKILILAHAPHPDITAIKQSIANNKNYQVTTAYANDPTINFAAYDFVILHQLPSTKYDASGIFKKIKDQKIPHLFILGTKTDYAKANTLQALVKLQVRGNNTDDVQAKTAPDFNLFTLDDRVTKELPRFPPLLSSFGEFTATANTDVLLYQRIGKIDTDKPLLVFGEQDNIKVGILCAEGIWKWRLFDFLQHQNHAIFDELMSKTIQYLTLKEDKRKFRVSISKNIFNENEQIYFDAELYNDSYELINEPEASIVVSNSEGKNYNFTFNKTTKAYSLNAGILPVGNYNYKASVMTNGKALNYKGQFSIQPIQLERYETTANHSLLKLLSEKYGGQLVYPSQATQIAQLLKDKGTVKPIQYQTSKTRSVINLKWICFLLIGLLTLEWFLRRYFGEY